jgi:hypothetical protein
VDERCRQGQKRGAGTTWLRTADPRPQTLSLKIADRFHLLTAIGVDFKIRTIELEGKTVKLQIVRHSFAFLDSELASLTCCCSTSPGA